MSALIGYAFYLLWAALHVQAGNAVARLGRAQHHSMIQARLYQDAWTLYFAAGLIAVFSVPAVVREWQSAYRLVLGIAFVTDVRGRSPGRAGCSSPPPASS